MNSLKFKNIKLNIWREREKEEEEEKTMGYIGGSELIFDML